GSQPCRARRWPAGGACPAMVCPLPWDATPRGDSLRPPSHPAQMPGARLLDDLVHQEQEGGGSVIPSAWAVLRLMTSSNVHRCSRGRAGGLGPRRRGAKKEGVARKRGSPLAP